MRKRTRSATAAARATSRPRKRSRGAACPSGGGGDSATQQTLQKVFDLAGKLVHAETRERMYDHKVRNNKRRRSGKGRKAKTPAEKKEDAAQLEKWTQRSNALQAELKGARAGVPWSAELPMALWEKIGGMLGDEKDLFAFAMTCKRFRGIQQRVMAAEGKEELVTRLSDPKKFSWKYFEKSESGNDRAVWDVSANWCEWAMESVYMDFLNESVKDAFSGKLDEEIESRRLFLLEIIGFYAGFQGYLETLQYWEKDTEGLFNGLFNVNAFSTVCGQALGGTLGGHIEILKWTIKMGYECDSTTFYFAAEGGDLDMLKFLKGKRCKWAAMTCTQAARSGHLEALQWLRQKRCPWDAMTCHLAAEAGRLETLKWARANGCPCDDAIVVKAAAAGCHLHILKWLKEDENTRIVPLDVCPVAAESNHVEILKWMRPAGGYSEWPLETSTETCAFAAFGGHLDLLKWLREENVPWDGAVCAAAADGGHLEILKWARENGCPWNESTCSVAASRGRMDILVWARENGCPWDELTYLRAIEGGHRDIVAYTQEQGLRLNAPAYIHYVIDFF